MTGNLESVKNEEARIHAAYAKRNEDVRYSWFSPGHLFMIQERERVFLELLRKKGISQLKEKKFWMLDAELDTGCVSLLIGVHNLII